MLQKLEAFFRDLKRLSGPFSYLIKNHRASSLQPKPWLFLLPDNIGDVLVQLPFIKMVTIDHAVTLVSYGYHEYTEAYLGIKTVTIPKFETRWAQKRFTKMLISSLSGPTSDSFIASTFDQPRLRALSNQVRTYHNYIYEGEVGMRSDLTNYKSGDYNMINNPFDKEEDTYDRAHIFYHLQYYYKHVFGFELTEKEHGALARAIFIRKLTDSESSPIVFIPHAGDAYRDVDAALWVHLEKTFENSNILVLGNEKRGQYEPQHATDLRTKTSQVEAMDIILQAKEVWTVENGLAHLAHLAGVQTNVFLGGGHYARFIPWPGVPDNLHIIRQADKSCFHCNWDCEFEELGDIPAPCLRAINPELISN